MAQVCKAVVRIHKHFYGKGPTKARAQLVENLLTVVLEGGFTRAEQTLRQAGRQEDVVRSRLAMQHSTEDVLRDAIEGIVGRSVRSVMSASDPSRDLQVEIFVLHPAGALGADGEGPVGTEILPDALGAESPDDGSEAADEQLEERLATRARQAREDHRRILDEHRALRAEQEQSRRAVEQERDRMQRGDGERR